MALAQALAPVRDRAPAQGHARDLAMALAQGRVRGREARVVAAAFNELRSYAWGAGVIVSP
jgi:hypothetical protein